MAELTAKDIENYEKLKTAFGKLNYTAGTPIREITNSVKAKLQETLSDDTNELRTRVDLVDGYLKIHSLLVPNKPEDVQEIKNLNEELDRSLKVVEDETLELTGDIETFAADSLFLKFLPLGDFKKWTEALFSDRDPNLTESQVNELTLAWGKSVGKFVEDARKKDDPLGQVKPGKPETFASFFRIHSELENLYSELADTEKFQSSR
jgi:hypothetical protein